MDQTPETINTTNTTEAMTPTQAAGRQLAGLDMPRWAQQALAAVGALALVGLLFVIGLQVAATQRGSTPAKVVGAQAGPYPLTVSLYKDPADAGFALPFAIAPAQPTRGSLTYSVMSIPGARVDATAVNASLSPDPRRPNGVTGTVEITVQGTWFLRIEVDGPSGRGLAWVPLTAKPPLMIPVWIAWPIGLIPTVGLALFFLAQRRARRRGATREATA